MLNIKKLLTKILSSLSTIGTSLAGTAQVSSVPSGTKTIVNQITLPKGKWLVIFQSAINVGTSKQFQSTISNDRGGYDYAAEQGGGALTGIVRHNLCWVFNVSNSQTVTGTMYQNAGSTLTINTNSLYAVRIGF